MTILLDVIASCRVPDDPPKPETPPAADTDPPPPEVMPSPSGVYLIHTAPSPRLDPSAGDLDAVEIDDDIDDEGVLKTFLVD